MLVLNFGTPLALGDSSVRGCRTSAVSKLVRVATTPRVPAQLKSVGPRVSHFTLSVERTCDEMHRQIRQQPVYIRRVEKTMLSTFRSLMNLRENLERATSRCALELQPGEELETQLPLMITKHDTRMRGTIEVLSAEIRWSGIRSGVYSFVRKSFRSGVAAG